MPTSSPIEVRRRGRARTLGVALALSLATLVALPTPAARAASDPCAAPVTSVIACENSKPGSPQSEWDITGYGDGTIQGFATDISVNVGDTVRFKVNTNAASYRLDIYRLGWYGGLGARKVATVNPSVPLPQSQPACMSDSVTLLFDCGNWAESASWAVPTTAVSGVYIARLVRADTGGASHIVFVVRNDASTSDLLFQTSDATWQAYNTYGGASLYPGPGGRAVKVSYNRPFDTRGTSPWGRDFVFANEYPMIRFLERNGYDVSYSTDVDSDRRGGLIKNHKAFLSVGHDEYWSGGQRANVEAARDAGVNLAFFSGNEVYWKTRWENSIAGPSTSYRTLVSYKETLSNAPVDPADPPTWTGTWRDPRFSPPADGGRPENALTGTAYMVNDGDFPIKVPAADGKMRFWRNTSVATQSPGQTATLAPSTLGYEFDADLDNGFRPAGLFHLSGQTEQVTQLLLDYGSTVAPGVSTYNMTMYRAPSGALVLGTGTIQWTWGLDDVHDAPSTPPAPDVRMQQATVNVLADMKAQPATLMAGLVAATASTDTTAPTSTITSPAPGASVPNGSSVTVTGTAADTGGGVVGGVEVSTDGGATWHPATGRESWTYTYQATGLGPVTLRSRAVDDSGNLETPSTGVTIDVTCPCTLFGQATPKTPSVAETTPLELGVRFVPAADGWVSGVRFYKGTGNTGTHTGSLWGTDGRQLATATFTGESATGWQTVSFAQAVPVTAGVAYLASYFAPNGGYAADTDFFRLKDWSAPPLTAPRDSSTARNGVYRAGSSGFPTQSFGSTNYWVDPVFTTVAPPDTTPPSVIGQTPPPGSSSNPTTTTPTASFSEPVQASTIAMTVTASGGTAVAGSVGYAAASRTATFTPSAPLAAGTQFTVTVSGAKDLAGNAMTTPVSWTFTTAATANPPGVCPCSIWTDATVPQTVTVNDRGGVELGVKFRSDVDGYVTGVRFYKGPSNTGTHTGSLWTTTGTRLATATFASESTSGWQTVTFAQPVAVTAGTVYVASYYTPTGYYSVNSNAFTSTGVDSPPLRVPAASTVGGNGVYAYGTGGFPSNASTANYWVDVVFTTPADTTPPTVTGTTPGADATSVPVGATPTATFSEPVQPASIGVTLKTSAGVTVAGTSAYDATARRVTFTPAAPLAEAARYTMTVSGAKDAAGNVLAAPVSWSFTTSGLAACPCTIWDSTATPGTPDANDTNAAELGVRFRPNADGYIYGIRFYKGPTNTGTHTASLWTEAGVQLATATFVGETPSGWQTVQFATPVKVTKGTGYIASYFAPVGRYAADAGYFTNGGFLNGPVEALANTAAAPNGVYRYGSAGFPDRTFGAANYWVDVVFNAAPPPDTTPPTVTGTAPVNGASSVPVGTTVSATFSEPVQASTVVMSLAAGTSPVTGATAYDAASRTATFTPGAALAAATTYTATVSGAKDLAGNTMTPVSWSFTTAAAPPPPGACPCSVWNDTVVPANPAVNDPNAVTVGLKFRATTAGKVTGVRFYKGVGNDGPHVGSLWSATGTLLAQATFAGETVSGWQQVLFSAPVAITANTTYVVSYNTTKGYYAATGGYFTAGTVTSGPLQALGNGVDGANGVYRYGANAFPTSSYGAANYWVDLVFETATP